VRFEIVGVFVVVVGGVAMPCWALTFNFFSGLPIMTIVGRIEEKETKGRAEQEQTQMQTQMQVQRERMRGVICLCCYRVQTWHYSNAATPPLVCGSGWNDAPANFAFL
jgi:hypothetical protein